MHSVYRAVIVYAVIYVLLRISGRRMLGQMSNFDLVLAMIITAAVRDALLDHDKSITNAVVLAGTLVALDVALSVLKLRSRTASRVLDGVPTLLVADGEVLDEPMRRARLNVADVISAARKRQGLERLDQVKFAVLERDGSISIVPRRDGGDSAG